MEIHALKFTEGEDVWCLGRITGADGSVLVQASITSWDLRVWDQTPLATVDPKTPIFTLLAQPSSAVVFNSLQTDGYWTRDARGYNFRHQNGASLWTAEGGHSYRVCYRFVTSQWGVKFGLYEFDCEETKTA